MQGDVRKRVTIVAVVIVPIAAVLALLGYGMTREPKYIPSPLFGRFAPPFTLSLFDGATLRLEELRGKVVFVNFWASWCPPCRQEARLLEATWQQYSGKGVAFVGVNIQDNEERAREFLREFGITYPNGMDHGSKIAVDYGVWGLPETFFIGRDGRITYKHTGAIESDTITAKLDEALSGVVSAGEGKGAYQSIR